MQNSFFEKKNHVEMWAPNMIIQAFEEWLFVTPFSYNYMYVTSTVETVVFDHKTKHLNIILLKNIMENTD